MEHQSSRYNPGRGISYEVHQVCLDLGDLREMYPGRTPLRPAHASIQDAPLHEDNDGDGDQREDHVFPKDGPGNNSSPEKPLQNYVQAETHHPQHESVQGSVMLLTIWGDHTYTMISGMWRHENPRGETIYDNVADMTKLQLTNKIATTDRLIQLKCELVCNRCGLQE